MRTESERRQLLEGISQNVNHKGGGGGGDEGEVEGGKEKGGGGWGGLGGSRKEKTTHLMLGYKIWACLG